MNFIVERCWLQALKSKIRLETVIFEKMLALGAKDRYHLNLRFGIWPLVYRYVLHKGRLEAC